MIHTFVEEDFEMFVMMRKSLVVCYYAVDCRYRIKAKARDQKTAECRQLFNVSLVVPGVTEILFLAIKQDMYAF